MTSENVKEDELNEPAKAEHDPAGDSFASFSSDARCPGETVAFKFGGSSLLGAERMLHAASIVRSSTPSCSVVVIVSAMKGVTDHLLAVGSALENGKLAAAREEAEGVINTHLDVLRDLQLDEDDNLSVRREMQSLCRDLLHDVNNNSRPVSGTAELLDRLASYGERLSA